jgi:cobaltochelatase CobT
MPDAALTLAQTRHQQRIDDLCAAAIRALCGQPGLHFRGRRLYRHHRALPPFSPHLHPQPGTDDFASFRGTADAMALRLRFADAELHRTLRPAEPLPRMLFEMLEQFRVESLAPSDMPGVIHNLRHRFEAWSMAFFNSGMTETSKGILLFTVAQITRSRVTAQPVVEATEDVIEATRMGIVPTMGSDLAGLRRQRQDQAAYAQHALAIAQMIADRLQSQDPEPDDQAQLSDDDEPDALDFNLWMDFEGDGADETPTLASKGSSAQLGDSTDDYRVFTREFDTEVHASTLLRAEQLREFRERLDATVERQGLGVSRWVRELQSVLAIPVREGWLDGQEAGRIDGRRLSQLIASPTERRLFCTEPEVPLVACACTFLIDCSGSMRAHIESVAVLVDVLARAMEQLGVHTEVLGFSTNAWNGGRAHRQWVRAGRPPHPGRLNETAHLIFKDSDTPWRQARHAMGALLKSELFREGVDGEALRWAAQRLERHTDVRRLLVVISDGSPTDGATALANDEHYLDHDLSNVVAEIEAQGRVEVLGLGVGLDLSPYYRRHRVLDLSNSVTQQVLRESVGLLAPSAGH